MKQQIDILNTVTTTYGVGGDVVNNTLSSAKTHRVNVVSGDVDVSYADLPNSALVLLEAAKTSATQNVYELSGIALLSFTANANSVVVITSE